VGWNLRGTHIMKLKRLLLASAVLGLAGTIGTANAATISATSVEIWNADTTGGQFGPASQALPTNPLAAGAPVAALTATTDPLNFNDGGTDTIGGFFSGTTLPGTCNSTCAADVLSSGNFSHATLFRFTFNEAINETFTVTHDDGVSLFADGSLVNLLPGEADPSTSETQSVDITPGNYVLWSTAYPPSYRPPQPRSRQRRFQQHSQCLRPAYWASGAGAESAGPLSRSLLNSTSRVEWSLAG
jgi:hypothetical protein